MNPLNHDAGDTPAPADPAVLAIAERSAQVIWRAFPYFGWRFSARGRSFGRSDAAYLTTLVGLPPAMQESQVVWLAKLLSARGMPSLLLEVQLDLLARLGRRGGWSGASAMSDLASQLRSSRQTVMPDEQLRDCERHFRTRTMSMRPYRRSIGVVIGAEVADRRLGYVQSEDATIGWLLAHGPDDPAWSLACTETRALAESVILPPS